MNRFPALADGSLVAAQAESQIMRAPLLLPQRHILIGGGRKKKQTTDKGK